MRIVSVVALLLLLSACDNDYDHHSPDSGHDHREKIKLKDFHLIDSNGHDSELNPNAALELDPYKDDGAFELVWHVNSLSGRSRVGVHDYTVEFFINDRPNLYGSVRIADELCGADLSCNKEGMQYCRYDTKSHIACDMYEAPRASSGVYIGDLLTTLPQSLYLLLEVCSTYEGSCELDYVPVTLR